METETTVVIVGAGPSGLAVSACLNRASVPNIVLERDDCVAPLWRHRTYDRLRLHLPKQMCQLPNAPYPRATPTYVPRKDILLYLDDYAERFGVRPLFHREVVSAARDETAGQWRLRVKKTGAGEEEHVQEEEYYLCRFLVVASGENDEPIIPVIPGLDTFPGVTMHSNAYRSSKGYEGKDVLVVGSGNSGMEIAYDLADGGARTSIVIRSPMHVVTKEIWHFGMFLSIIFPYKFVDMVVLFLCYLKFGDTSKYGMQRPSRGPFDLKANTTLYPVVDVGTYDKIKSYEIQVLPPIDSVKGDKILFENGMQKKFDSIIFATGYKSTTKKWLKGDSELIGNDGMAKEKFPNHWRGRDGLYCAGLVRRGFHGSSEDAQHITNDIVITLSQNKQKIV